VYGEELDQRDAMWWSPDSSKLAFYELDERNVPDHFITAGLTDLHTRILTEGYPKPGEPNPIANLMVYDLASNAVVRLDAMPEGEWYTYNIRWSPDGKSLLFNRTNRRQDVLHVMGGDPATGKTRTIVTEKQDTWQENRPLMQFLADGQRFIWETERSGWKNYELRDLDGELVATLTNEAYPVAGVERIDEASGVLYYMAYSEPSCPLNAQLHRVNLDGSNPQRLTQEPLNHSVQMSPDNKWFITTYEAIDAPPASALYSASGERIATLAESDRSKFEQMGLEMPELFTFTADDGVTPLHGALFKPSDFSEASRYPVVVEVYGGPASVGLRNRFSPAIAACEYGFLIARIENRGTINRGKAFESATYLELGDKDLRDQADGVRFLAGRPYVDGARVGIYGHSYGGYMSALALLKQPDVFHVGVAGAPVTDWKNYDTIYTERYMRTPQENPDGYKIGSCLEYAKNLKGDLLIVHGMVDDNVHPNNTFQLIDLLQQADLPFEIMLYPNFDHGVGGNYSALRWRFLRKHLLDDN
jgi:dipeptidyl-peptidase 4